LLSRLIIIPFNAVFSKADPDYDPYIIDKLCSEEAMEYLIQLGLDGLYEVINNRAFTESEAVQKEKEEYERFNNPVKEWIDFDEPNIIGVSTDEVYEQYVRYCTDAGLNAMSKSGLSRYIKNKMGLTTTNIRRHGKQMRVYAEITSSATS
jgi:putative DNA primase/helicase